MAWDKQVPYDRATGSILHGVWAHIDDRIDWRHQAAFEAVLKMEKVNRYGHTVYFTFQDLGRPGATYPVFCSGIQDIFAQTHRGKVEGLWLPVKRGNCWAVELTDKPA